MPLEVDPSREGALFRVKATPGARRSEAKGEHGGALKVAVAAPPEKGKANEELLRFLAKALGVDRASMELVAGAASREKRLRVRGMEAGALEARLAALAGAPAGKRKQGELF